MMLYRQHANPALLNSDRRQGNRTLVYGPGNFRQPLPDATREARHQARYSLPPFPDGRVP